MFILFFCPMFSVSHTTEQKVNGYSYLQHYKPQHELCIKHNLQLIKRKFKKSWWEGDGRYVPIQRHVPPKQDTQSCRANADPVSMDQLTVVQGKAQKQELQCAPLHQDARVLKWSTQRLDLSSERKHTDKRHIRLRQWCSGLFLFRFCSIYFHDKWKTYLPPQFCL